MASSSDYFTYKHNVSCEEAHGYVQVVRVGETAYFSGQFAHEGEKIVAEGDFGAQCDAAFINLDKCLEKAGATRNQVVHSEVLVVDLSKNMEVMTSKHKQFFGSHRPASTVWGVTALGQPHMLVEIKFTVRLDLPATPKTFSHIVPWEDAHNYSQVIVAGETAWISGQFAHDAEGNPIGEGDFEKQCEAAFANLDKCLEAIGATRNQVVHVGSMIVGLNENSERFSVAHKKYFGECTPVSTIWGVTGLGLPFMNVEICAIVRLDAPKNP